MSSADPAYWDGQAGAFDDEPDHGLRDPASREAWHHLLAEALPPPPADVLDLGCGTGTLSLLLAEAGHRVTGMDFSPAMVAAASAKAAEARLPVSFAVGDAADPDAAPGSFDVVLCRHVLWALPEPDAVLARWARLLRPGGRLVLVEGSWSTGAGLTAAECERLVRTGRDEAVVTHLPDPVYWGRAISDERYLLVSRR